MKTIQLTIVLVLTLVFATAGSSYIKQRTVDVEQLMYDDLRSQIHKSMTAEEKETMRIVYSEYFGNPLAAELFTAQ